ncbi:MAG: ABC transporter ATP-binding protein [Candidatus Methylomirabilia bacterium]
MSAPVLDPSTSSPLVVLAHVSKWYDTGAVRTAVLSDASLVVEPGQFVVVLGPSGSGKTTLLNLIGAMDTPSSGHLMVAGVDLSASSSETSVAFRRNKIGFVFQFYNLFPTLTAAENVEIALEILDLSRQEIARRTRVYLDAVGLLERGNAFPAQLSGGEQQRVAIARALAKEPPLVLADEPTGNLDRQTGERVVLLMKELNRRTGAAFIVVTHNPQTATAADRVVHIAQGKIVEK